VRGEAAETAEADAVIERLGEPADEMLRRRWSMPVQSIEAESAASGAARAMGSS